VAATHAEWTSDGKRDETCGPAPATAQTAGRGGDIVLLYGDESEALPYLARAWAKSGRTCACRRPGKPRRSRCWGRSITSPANSSFMTPPTSGAAISSSISSNSTVSMDRSPGDKPSRSCWSDPQQQTLARRAGGSRALAHRRVAAEIRARTQRHRAGLARPQGPSPRPPDLHRRHRARPRHPRRRHKSQPRADP
jgi:hypothetical protein